MQRTLVILGVLLVVLGLGWSWLSKLPLGRLPGDLVFERPGIRVFIPLTTGLLISLLLSLLLWLFRRG